MQKHIAKSKKLKTNNLYTLSGGYWLPLFVSQVPQGSILRFKPFLGIGQEKYQVTIKKPELGQIRGSHMQLLLL